MKLQVRKKEKERAEGCRAVPLLHHGTTSRHEYRPGSPAFVLLRDTHARQLEEARRFGEKQEHRLLKQAVLRHGAGSDGKHDLEHELRLVAIGSDLKPGTPSLAR